MQRTTHTQSTIVSAYDTMKQEEGLLRERAVAVQANIAASQLALETQTEELRQTLVEIVTAKQAVAALEAEINSYSALLPQINDNVSKIKAQSELIAALQPELTAVIAQIPLTRHIPEIAVYALELHELTVALKAVADAFEKTRKNIDDQANQKLRESLNQERVRIVARMDEVELELGKYSGGYPRNTGAVKRYHAEMLKQQAALARQGELQAQLEEANRQRYTFLAINVNLVAKFENRSQELSALQPRLIEAQETLAELNAQKERKNNSLVETEGALETQIDSLEQIQNDDRELKARHAFVIGYQEEPAALFNDLLGRLRSALASYARLYPNDHTIHAEVFSRELNDLSAVVSVEARQDQVKQLTGLVYKTLDTLMIDNQYNFDLYHTLQAALGDDVIEREEAIEAYNLLKTGFIAELPDRAVADEDEIKREKFRLAKRRFLTIVNPLLPTIEPTKEQTILSDAAMNLYHTVSDVEDEALDFGYRAELLHAAADAYDSHMHGNKPSESFAEVIGRNTDGKRSIPKLVIGAAMMFAGVALMALALASVVFSLGASVPLVIAAAVVGGGLVVSGSILFTHGMEKDTAEAITDFDKAVHKFGLFRPTEPLLVPVSGTDLETESRVVLV